MLACQKWAASVDPLTDDPSHCVSLTCIHLIYHIPLQDSDGEKSDQDLVVDDEHQPSGGASGFQPTNGERSPRENGPNTSAVPPGDKKKDPMSPRSDTSSHVRHGPLGKKCFQLLL